MPIGNAVPCPSCGQKFFPSSMKFHLKQCERKQAAMIVECPACGTSMPQAEIPAHMEKCPVARQQQRRLQERDATARGRRTGPARGPDGAGAAFVLPHLANWLRRSARPTDHVFSFLEVRARTFRAPRGNVCSL